MNVELRQDGGYEAGVDDSCQNFAKLLWETGRASAR